MKQLLTYRYRLYPTQNQEKEILRTAEVVRRYYNAILHEKTAVFLETGIWKRKLDILEQADKFAQKYHVKPAALKYAAGEFDRAFRRYMWIARTKEDQYKESAKGRVDRSPNMSLTEADLKGYPEEKPWSAPRKSYCLPPSLLMWQQNSVMLPQVGWIRVKLHRFPPEASKMVQATVLYKSSGRFYLLLEFEIEVEDKRPDNVPDEALGVVFLPGELAIRSDGYPVEIRHTDPDLEDQIRRAYKTLRRRKPGSKGYDEQRKKLALNRKIILAIFGKFISIH